MTLRPPGVHPVVGPMLSVRRRLLSGKYPMTVGELGAARNLAEELVTLLDKEPPTPTRIPSSWNRSVT